MLLCEDDGVEMVEFEDVEGIGYACPDCHWIVMAKELEPQEAPKRERREITVRVVVEFEPGETAPDDALHEALRGELGDEFVRVGWYDDEQVSREIVTRVVQVDVVGGVGAGA